SPLCSPKGPHILYKPQHSTSFDCLQLQQTAAQELLCDHSLPPAWYCFLIHNRPAEMQSDVSRSSDSLAAPGESKRLTACGNLQLLRGTKHCCLFRIPIRNCGEFFVYLLQPTPGCMACCAEG
ncbi:VWDE protein, partial [Indicator maculatus]|nr:VWDE protein [Indicator maculatus]